MDEYQEMKTIQMNHLATAFGIKLHVNKLLPPGSALFMNHIGEVVAIYSDGQLVEVPLDSAINYLAHYPLALKKKPLLEVSDE